MLFFLSLLACAIITDDAAPEINPGTTEICDNPDKDCDDATTETGPVTVNGAGTFTDLQRALKSTEGDDVLVLCGGTWTDPFEILSDLSLIGVVQPVLDGQSEGSTVLITALVISPDRLWRTGETTSRIAMVRLAGRCSVRSDGDSGTSEVPRGRMPVEIALAIR